MSDDRYEKVKHDGKTVDRYTDYNLYLAEERLGYPLTIVQGSYNKGVAASAGSHDGGGVVDLLPWDWEHKVRVLRELGFAAWHRTRSQGFSMDHIHAVLLGNEKASPLAKQQMDAYRRGRNGLANNGYDTFWRPNPIVPARYKEAAAVVYPADVFGKNWKLTVPADGPDSGAYADDIKQPELATYTSLFCRVPSSDASSVLFTVHHGAPTTTGSKNPRSELREMANQGLNLAKWDGRTGKHRMGVELAVNRLTKVKPHTVLAQIHTASDDLTVLRAEGVKGTNRVKLWATRGDDAHAHYISEVTLTQRFRFAFDVAGGKVRFDFNGQRLGFTVPAEANCYFKTGAYLQSNPQTAPSETTAAYTQVRLFGRPEVTHE